MKNREADDRDDFESILPEYGRRKLLTCAESIRELAESFQETRENREILPEENRNDFLCQRRLFENGTDHDRCSTGNEKLQTIKRQKSETDCPCHERGRSADEESVPDRK